MSAVITDGAVLELLKARATPVAASTLAVALGVHTQTVAAALSHLEDEGKARIVGSSGQPRGASGVRLWVAA